jgi:hypothetical protein
MNTQEMRQAMSTLRQFSEKDKNYFAYQARQNYLRQQMSVYGELDATKLREQQALAERDSATLREQQALAERDAATAEIEKLKALLVAKQS